MSFTNRELDILRTLAPSVRGLLIRALQDPARKQFLNWLIKYTNYSSNAGPKKYKLPKPEIIEYASQFTKGSYTVYRGMGWQGKDVEKAVQNLFGGKPPTKKQVITFKAPGMSSWTLDRKQADKFARGNAWIILEASVSGGDVVLDTVNMAKQDKELGNEIMFPQEQEVILKPGTHKAKIIDLKPPRPDQWDHLVKTLD